MSTYAQIHSGQRLHIVAEPGDEYYGEIIRKGYLSAPLCRTNHFNGSYRMTCKLPLGNACKNCQRIWRSGRRP